MNSTLPKEIIFSDDAHKNIADIISKYGQRVYILRAGDSFKKSSWAKSIISSIKKSKLELLISEPISAEPDTDKARELLKEARDFKADIICGIGGGSVMDLAKVVAALYYEIFSDISEYLYSKSIKTKGIKLVLVPTISGSGSEVSASAVLKDKRKKTKKGIRDRKLIADAVLIDPALTLTLKREQTLYSSLDALTHALESYVSLGSDLVSSVLAKGAAELIYRNLEKTLKEPQDIELRNKLALSSLFAGISFSSAGLGLGHALSHPIGAIYNIPHGLANAVIIPYVIEFNYPFVQESYQDLIFDKRYKSLYNLLKSYFKRLGIASDFKELGFKLSAKIKEKIAGSTLDSGVIKYNPRSVKREDIYYILERLWGR
jgi:alcohol dehydrogenase class IV